MAYVYMSDLGQKTAPVVNGASTPAIDLLRETIRGATQASTAYFGAKAGAQPELPAPSSGPSAGLVLGGIAAMVFVGGGVWLATRGGPRRNPCSRR